MSEKNPFRDPLGDKTISLDLDFLIFAFAGFITFLLFVLS